jgi:CubicO group peptidase (beta-lactamase class C family)
LIIERNNKKEAGMTNARARHASHIKLQHLLGAVALSINCLAQAQTPPAPALPDASASDPRALKWMQGSPPPSDRTIRFGDGSFYRFPQLRWSFSHMRELVPTAAVWHGTLPVTPFARLERSGIDELTFNTLDGKSITWAESLALNYTDGIVVLHKGHIVYERYSGALDPHLPHAAFSVTKSLVGTLAETLVVEEKINPEELVTHYVPELKDSAYGDATVRQVMDMTVGVKYSEDYADPRADVFDYARAGGMLPAPAGYAGPRTFYDFLATLKKEGNHGAAFAYKTSNAEVLAWIVERASGKGLAELASERIWRKLGVENDAYFTVDSIGAASGGGGFNATLRDLARFGEMMRNGGWANWEQVIPKTVVDDIRKGGDKDLFANAGFTTLPGASYRDMWWVLNNEDGAYMARGIHGQALYIDPKAEMVIARFASNPRASNVANDPVSLPAYKALADFLMKPRE